MSKQEGMTMKRWTKMMVVAAIFVPAAACAENGATGVRGSDINLGVIPIGGKPQDLQLFVSTDCGKVSPAYADCSAQDTDGRRYAFFDGVLSKISIRQADAASTLKLPAALEFGENIERAAERITKVMAVKLDRAPTHDGHVVYSSDFVLKSSAGVMYSIELIADEQGRLVEIVARTDF